MTAPEPNPDQPVPDSGYAVPPDLDSHRAGGGAEPVRGPLVPHPQRGLGALWQQLNETLQRSGRTVAQILLLTVALPQIAGAIGMELLADGLVSGTDPLSWSGEQLAVATGGAVAVTLLWSLVLAWLAAWGWTAGIVAVTEQAAGAQSVLGLALRRGARRMWPMTGWFLLYILMVGVGLLFLLAPGLYLAMAGGLFSLVVVYEGRGGIGRSFALVHSAFGAALGRIGLVLLFLLSAYCVLGVCLGGLSTSTSASRRLLGDVISNLASVPLLTVVLVALLLTYAQLRARREPLTTDQLVSAARRSTGDDPAGASPAGI